MWALIREPCVERVALAAPTVAPCPKTRGRWILAATILGSSMAFIDGTVVNVALPALQTDLNATAADVQWVIEAYSLLLSAFLLVGGSLGDHFGRRRLFVTGVALFALASTACGLAVTIHQLILARALQGFAAALLVPGSLALISNSFSKEQRGRAIGTWSGLSAMTTALGPVLGGWLIEHFSWRAVFFINLPIALIVILISLRYVVENRSHKTGDIDLLGAIVAVSGLGALVYGLIESSQRGFNDSTIIIVLIGAAALIALFILIEARSANPMLPLALFRSPIFSGTNLLTFFLYAALGGTLFFLPLNLIQVQHYSTIKTGAALLPFVLTISLVSRWSGALVERYGARLPLMIGPAIAALGYLLFIPTGVGNSYWTHFFPPIAMLGLGMAITVAPLTTTVMNSIPQEQAGVASGVNNAITRTAALIAVAVFGIVMMHVFSLGVSRRLSDWNVPAPTLAWLQTERMKLAAIALPPELDAHTSQLIRRAIDESFVDGFRVVMAIGATLASASALTAFALIRKPSKRATPHRFEL